MENHGLKCQSMRYDEEAQLSGTCMYKEVLQ